MARKTIKTDRPLRSTDSKTEIRPCSVNARRYGPNEMGLTEEAVRDLCTDAVFDRGRTYREQGRYESATVVYRALVESLDDHMELSTDRRTTSRRRSRLRSTATSTASRRPTGT
jgi:hypothetical protein